MTKDILRPWVNRIQWLENAALVFALISMLGLAVLQIVLRNVFDGGFLWAESFLRILVLWVAILGGMVATRENNHINIDALSRFLPERFQRLLQIVTGLFSAAICGTVAWYSFEYVNLEYQDETIAFASVPTWMCQAILPFGFAVICIRFSVRAMQTIFDQSKLGNS